MVAEEKVKKVAELRKLIEESPVVCIIDLHKMPSKQLQEIAKKIRSDAKLAVSKRSLMMLAIKDVKRDGISEVEKLIPKQPAIICTSMEPFKIFATIDRLRSATFAKGGDVAISDIQVTAGPTNLMAGPAISEFTKLSIPAGVEDGKIAVKKDVVVVKAGQAISSDLASVLKKLNIQPMQVSMNIVAIYDGKLYRKDVLELVNAYPQKLVEAHSQAYNLSVVINYPTKENIKTLLAKAYSAMKAIEGLMTKEKVEVQVEAKTEETVKTDGG